MRRVCRFAIAAAAITLLAAIPAGAQIQGCYAPDTGKATLDPRTQKHSCLSVGAISYCGQQTIAVGFTTEIVCRRCCARGESWNAAIKQCCPLAGSQRGSGQVAPEWPPPMTR
jgi:hypothetical protein